MVVSVGSIAFYYYQTMFQLSPSFLAVCFCWEREKLILEGAGGRRSTFPGKWNRMDGREAVNKYYILFLRKTVGAAAAGLWEGKCLEELE